MFDTVQSCDIMGRGNRGRVSWLTAQNSLMKLPPQDVRTLVAIIRHYLEAIRESTALKAILRISVQHQACPSDWEDQLSVAKASSQYNDIGKEIESTIVRFEQDADETELLAQFQKMTQGPLR